MSCTDDISQHTSPTEKPTLGDFRIIRFVRQGGELHEFVAASFHHQVLSSSELANESFLAHVKVGMMSAEIRAILAEYGFEVSVETNLDGYRVAMTRYREAERQKSSLVKVSLSGKVKSKKLKTKGR